MDQCKNCGSILKGKYCHKCGQKKFEITDLSLKNYFIGVIKDFTHFDFKLFKDIPSLIFRLGFLTKEYIEGRIAKHIKPITMFIWINVFFFLFVYAMVLPQAKIKAANGYWPGLEQKAYAKAAKENLPQIAYVEKFNHHLESYEKYLFFIIIPVFALFLFLLNSYKRNNYYAKHFVYSIHFWSYFFIYFTVAPQVAGLLNELINAIFGSPLYTQYDGPVFFSILLLGVVPYTFAALLKVY